jgi:hypothetical protein
VLLDARVRHERGHRAQDLQRTFVEQRAHVVEALARGDRERLRAPFEQRFVEATGSGFRARAPVAIDAVDVRPAGAQRIGKLVAPALAAEDHDAPAADVRERGQREQPFAVVRRLRNRHVRHADRVQGARGARARRVCRHIARPPSGRAVLRGVRGHEYRSVVRRERCVRARERRIVARRQDCDRGKHDGRRAERCKLRGQPRRLPRGARDDHADTRVRPASAH